MIVVLSQTSDRQASIIAQSRETALLPERATARCSQMGKTESGARSRSDAANCHQVSRSLRTGISAEREAPLLSMLVGGQRFARAVFIKAMKHGQSDQNCYR
jgi:hypothetical protein